jgi:hypothetical protein
MLKLLDGRHNIVNHHHHRHHLHGFRHQNHNHHRQHHYNHNQYNHHQHQNIRIRIKCYRSQSLYSSRSKIAPTTSVTSFQGQQSAMLNRDQQSQLLQHFYFSTKTNNVNLALNSCSSHHHHQQQQLYHINSHILSRISNQQRLYHRHHHQQQQLLLLQQQQHAMKNMIPKKIVSLAINEYIYIYILIQTTALMRCIITL